MKKILLFMFCMILLIGTVSAMDWDNIKSYDEETKIITVINALNLPLIGYDIAKIQLKTPLEYKVPRGYQKVAEFELYNFEKDYINAFKDMNFYHVNKDLAEFERDFDYKYLDYINEEQAIYGKVCESRVINGTLQEVCKIKEIDKEIVQVPTWIKFNDVNELPSNQDSFTIGIFTIVEKGDRVEWIPTFFGVRIDEWATWTESLNVGLVAYYALDETSDPVIDSHRDNDGTTTGATPNVTGKINTAYSFDGDDDYITVDDDPNLTLSKNMSISVWVKPITGNVMYILNKGVFQQDGYLFGIDTTGVIDIYMSQSGAYQRTQSDEALANDVWSHVVLSCNNGNCSIYLNGTEYGYNIQDAHLDPADGATTLLIGIRTGLTSDFNGSIDEIGIWNRSLSPAEIENLWNEGNGISFFTSILLNFPINNYNSTSPVIIFNGTISHDYGEIVNVSLIIDGIYNETNYSGINYIDYIFTKTISEGTHNWTYELCDNESKCTTASVRNLFIDFGAPEINVTYPTATIDHHLLNTNLSLNWTVSDIHLDSCWYDYNGTNISVTCSDNHTNINITEISNRNVTFYANDTLEKLNSFYHEWYYTIFEISQEFNNESLEGSINTFTANVTIEESNSIIIANFIYNEISTIGSFSQSGNDSILTIDFLVPNVNTDSNLTFFWSLTLSDAQIINLTLHNQTVIAISLDNCSTNTIVLYNYTIVDEGNQSLLSNTTTELNINLLDERRQNHIFNFSLKYSKINPFAVCINKNLSSSTYIIDSITKYQATGYAIEYYNIVNATITNLTIPESITLYDLASADSTEFKITFKAEDFTFIEDALIYIDRQYIAENNTFKTVELPKTDSDGQTIGHFVRNDVVYNIRVIKDGVVLGNFKNKIAFCEDYAIGACQMILEATPEDFITFDYDEQLGIIFQSLPTYNENTSAISFDFSTDDGTTKTVLMEVTRDDIFGNRSICNNTITSSSGTLSCSFDPNIDDSVLRVSVSVDGQPVVLSNVKLESSDYGNIGYILWFFLTFLFILLFAHSKTEVLIGLSISFIGAITLGITKGDIIGLGSAGIWMLVIIILGIYKLNKEKPQ